jgi:hypothetical protein
MSRPGAARTILLFHTISDGPSKQPRMVGSTLGVYSFALIFVSARTNKRHYHLHGILTPAEYNKWDSSTLAVSDVFDPACASGYRVRQSRGSHLCSAVINNKVSARMRTLWKQIILYKDTEGACWRHMELRSVNAELKQSTVHKTTNCEPSESAF